MKMSLSSREPCALTYPVMRTKGMSMFHLLFVVATVLCCASAWADEGHGSTNMWDHFDRTLTLIKEPKYESAPKYCLLVLGRSGDVKVWMVEDGQKLFVDRNANGDLTDDGPPIEPSKVRNLSANQRDFSYLLDAITPTNGSRHLHFDLRRWNYGATNDSYGLSLSVDGQLPLYAGWFGTFWSAQCAAAPVVHFGGKFTPKLLRFKEFTIGAGPRRLSLGFMNPGSGAGAESRLSIEAVPSYFVPKLTIDWPTAGASPPLRTSHQLNERCCYWEFYTSTFTVPKGAVVGKAKVSVELPASKTPIVLTTTEFEVQVTVKSESDPAR